MCRTMPDSSYKVVTVVMSCSTLRNASAWIQAGYRSDVKGLLLRVSGNVPDASRAKFRPANVGRHLMVGNTAVTVVMWRQWKIAFI